MLSIFLRGLLIGFSIAAPVGPIGLLCIRRTLADGRAIGFVSGLGAATADAFYGAVAGFGLTVVSRALVQGQTPLRLVGGAFLCYLGVRTFLARPAQAAGVAGPRGLLGAYLSTLGLTLTNPSTILSFVAIFAGLGLAANADYGSAFVVVTGVFIGSASWWIVLAAGAGWLRGRIGPALFRAINIVSGLTILGFAIWQLAVILR